MDSAPLALADFVYDLPKELIATEPAEPRDSSRLLRLGRQDGAISHHRFTDLCALLSPGDLLVVNQTQVVPARVHLRTEHGGAAEILFVRRQSPTTFLAMGRPGSALKAGKKLIAPDGTSLHVTGREGAYATLHVDDDVFAFLSRVGEMPLPPYMERAPTAADRQNYQTLFAATPGAVAAPTASLHFTPAVIKALAERGIKVARLTLHVGPGTFTPVRKEHAGDVRAHVMHHEWYDIPEQTLDAIRETKHQGGRIIAVGTTVVRALENYAASEQAQGEAGIFIYPGGHMFKIVQGLVTNFHLPASTLLMLVSAFAGRTAVMAAYREAIAQRYRFYSYGDAMLLL